MKRSAVALLLSFAAGCLGSPQETARTTNPDFVVEFLFDHEGCRVYRFRDEGHVHYYTSCRGSAITVRNPKLGGPDEIQTSVAP